MSILIANRPKFKAMLKSITGDGRVYEFLCPLESLQFSLGDDPNQWIVIFQGLPEFDIGKKRMYHELCGFDIGKRSVELKMENLYDVYIDIMPYTLVAHSFSCLEARHSTTDGMGEYSVVMKKVYPMVQTLEDIPQ